MYFDALTLAALVDEFEEKIVGGRVQDTIDVDPTGIGLEIYAHRERRYLYISADQQTPRVHLVDGKLRRGLFKPTQLGLLFRRYVEGGIVEKVHQPEWYERILFIDISHVEGQFRIVVEPMERRANILLLNDSDMILDCIHRVGPKDNSYRLSLPNHDYVLPPPMDRFDPTEVTVEQMQQALDNEDPKQKVRYMLTSALVGFSPLVAQEVTHRTYGYYNQKVRDADAEISTDVRCIARSVPEGITGLGFAVMGLRRHIRDHLQLSRGPYVFDADEIGKAGNEAAFTPRGVYEVNPLLLPCDYTQEVDPPRVRSAAEAELRQRNDHLGRPTLVVHARLCVPDRVPGDVFLDIVEYQDVLFDAARVDGEGEGGAPVAAPPTHAGAAATPRPAPAPPPGGGGPGRPSRWRGRWPP